MSTDVGYGISSKFRIDDSDLGKLDRRLMAIAKNISGIKRSLVDAIYGREVQSALSQLERRLSNVTARAARAGRSAASTTSASAAAAAGVPVPSSMNALVPTNRWTPYGWSAFRGGGPRMIGQDADWAGSPFGGGGGGRPRGPYPWGWDSAPGMSNMVVWGGGGGLPPRPPTPRQIGGPSGPIPQYGSWNQGWAGFGHPAASAGPGQQYGPHYVPWLAGTRPNEDTTPPGWGVGRVAAGVAVGGAMLAYGAGTAMREAAGYAVDTQREAEMGRQGITAALSAFGGVPIGQAQSRSANIFQGLEKAAAIGPGETNDYAFAFQRIFGPLSQRGASDKDIMKLVSQSIAGGSMLWGSGGAKFGPMDIMQALTSGVTDRTTPLAAMALQSAGYDRKTFEGAQGKDQVRMLIEGFGKLEPAVAIFGRTVDAQEHTFAEAMKRMIRTVSDPAYEIYRRNLIAANESLAANNDSNKDAVEAARDLTTGLAVATEHGVKGFMAGLETAKSGLVGGARETADALTSSADIIYAASNMIGQAIGSVAAGLAIAASGSVNAVTGAFGTAKQQGMRGPHGAPLSPLMNMMLLADWYAGPNHSPSTPFDMVANTPGATNDFNMLADVAGASDEDEASARLRALQQAMKSAGGGAGRGREITIRIADFKVDITEPRAVARSYKRVVSDALTQLARSGLDTATDGVVL